MQSGDITDVQDDFQEAPANNDRQMSQCTPNSIPAKKITPSGQTN